MSGILMASVGNSYGSAPVNTVAPVVSGTATVGQTLSTTNGTWTGAPAPTFTYQWQRTGVDISGATSSTYVLVAADYANTIRCVVKATNSVAPSGVTANSNSTASVAGNAPVNTVAPAVTGTATVGQTLSTTNGTWTGVPTPTFTYQWQRVTTNISGATSSTYVLVDADGGSTIRCVVTATNAVSAVSANSNSTAAVAAIAPGAPTIGTATKTGSSTATVAYTAPASNGGATITSYTATSTPSSITGTLSQAGSGTITVSGLAASTAYTFTVTATNSAGTSAASAASNSITTDPVPAGQVEYTRSISSGAANFSWTAPTGVNSVTVLVIAWGRNGGTAGFTCCNFRGGVGGPGGGLVYTNNIAVTPGNSYTVAFADPAQSDRFYFGSTANGYAQQGSNPGTGGTNNISGGLGVNGSGRGQGGTGRFSGSGGGSASNANGGGGGGGPGYSPIPGGSDDGRGGATRGSGNAGGGTTRLGGGGGAGSESGFSNGGGAAGGGGTGALGATTAGAGGTWVDPTSNGGAGGSGGTAGGTVSNYATQKAGGAGGNYGAGGGGGGGSGGTGGAGGQAIIRIIWAGGTGITREYPSTNTGNL